MDIGQRGANVNAELNNTKQNPLLSGFKATAQVFGGIGDTAGQILNSSPFAAKIIQGVSKVYSDITNPSNNGLLQQLGRTLQSYEQTHPQAVKAISSILEGTRAAGDISNNILAADGLRVGANNVANLGTKAADTISTGFKDAFPESNPRNLIETTVRETAQPYKAANAVLTKAETTGSNPIKAIASYGDQALPDLVDGKLYTADAQKYLRTQIADLGQLKSDLLFTSDATVSFPQYRQYVNDLIDGNRGWTAPKKAAIKAKASSVIDNLEAGYANAPIAKGGELPLTELDKIKTEQTSLSSSYKAQPGSFEYDLHGVLGKGARDLVDTLSGDNAQIAELNKWIQSHYDAIALYKTLEGKAPKGGKLTAAFTRLGGEVTGAVAGGSLGHPIVGAFAGRVIADRINGIIQNDLISNPLKRAMIAKLAPEAPDVVKAALKYLDDNTPTLSDLQR